jgi:broad-specificity NMP kinase
MDYVQSQYRMRTFWTAYILDNYLGVVFGRPRHFHDDDIDQEYPDRVHDEEITPMGPLESHQDATRNCHIDALIFHAKIAKIIGSISREVYTTKKTSYQERIDAAHRHIQQIHEWRSSLPLYLGSIDPSMLIPSYRRQAIVLKLAKNHAIIHASRLFILSNRTSSVAQESYVEDCMSAAKTVLETVDQLAKDGPIFHAFWWTHYVTFCSLIVVYVFQMQQRRLGQLIDERNNSREKLLELAEACQTHLALATASNSPSRRYAVILEEFRAAAMSQQRRSDHDHRPREVVASMGCDENEANQGAQPPVAYGVGSERSGDQTPLLDSDLLDAWQTTDWLELDSSVSCAKTALIREES